MHFFIVHEVVCTQSGNAKLTCCSIAAWPSPMLLSMFARQSGPEQIPSIRPAANDAVQRQCWSESFV